MDDLPIDLVYTWVNGEDPNWVKKKMKYMKLERKILPNSYDSVRFRNLDELKYSIRSVRKFAPFIRKIFIVTNGQTPSWLKTKSLTKGKQPIIMVKHEEIFLHKSDLPTFNSVAIEANLHRIPGLAEHFIYFNDDVFFGKKVTPSNFLTSDGKSKIYLRSKDIPSRKAFKEDDYYFRDGIYYTHKFLKKHVDKKDSHRAVRHVGYLMRKSVLQEIEDLLKKTNHWDKTMSRFRKNYGIKIISLFYPYYALEKGYAVEDNKLRAINASKNFHQNYKKILNERPHMFCLNSLLSVDTQLKTFFKKYFPDKGPEEVSS